MWSPSFPLLNEGRIKWFFFCFLFYIRFRWPPNSPLLKERNLSRGKENWVNHLNLLTTLVEKKFDLGLQKIIWWPPTRVFFFPTWRPLGGHQVISTLNCEGRPSGPPIVVFFFFLLKNHNGQLGGHQVDFYFFLLRDLVAIKSFWN